MHSGLYRATIALGANVGPKLQRFHQALTMLGTVGHVERTSALYVTEPLYVKEQPAFYNAALTLITDRAPAQLLGALQQMERELGREGEAVGALRYGPRPIDLDIVWYEQRRQPHEPFQRMEPLHTAALQVPHAKLFEREFVLRPMRDLGHALRAERPQPGAVQQVLPFLSDDSYLEVCRPSLREPHIMGILNVTPDSFSDGSERNLLATNAVAAAERLVRDGATVLDVGGQSTRPGAAPVPPEQEEARVVPVIRALREVYPRGRGIFISVDTFSARVARAALAVGADLINDVSAGGMDADMLRTAAEQGVPIVLMHMRGNPQTMMDLAEYDTDQVACTVAAELAERVAAAERAGIPRWHIIVDPGLGFAKHAHHCLELLRDAETFRQGVQAGGSMLPLLVGPSRKRLLAQFCGPRQAVYAPVSPGTPAAATPISMAARDPDASTERDFATAGAVAWATLQRVDFVRVHRPAVCDAARLVAHLQSSADAPAASADQPAAPSHLP